MTGEESRTCFPVPSPPFQEIRFDGFDQAVALVARILLDHDLATWSENVVGNGWTEDPARMDAAKAIVLALFPELA